MDTLVKWMSDDDFDLGLIYFNEPDHTGHVAGPFGADTLQQVERMDGILGLLLDKLEEVDLLVGTAQWVAGSFVCLFRFLTSSSATRLSRERAPRRTEAERGDHDSYLSRSHCIDTDPTSRERAPGTGKAVNT